MCFERYTKTSLKYFHQAVDTVELPTNFVALGFSTDMKKGKDLVLVCKFPAQLNPQVYKGYARVQLT